MLKMSVLTKETGESKSTILYYVKEGLLPQPTKLKPNVHLYKKESINIIKLIKYFQTNFSYSISQIKKIFENSEFDFNNNIDVLIKSLSAISNGSDNLISYSKDEAMEKLNISEKELDDFLKFGFVLPKNRLFNQKDMDMLKILVEAKRNGVDEEIFREYVRCAKELARKEYEMGSHLLHSKELNSNLDHKLMFDIILSLKPYIFNKYTIEEHTNRVTEKVNATV